MMNDSGESQNIEWLGRCQQLFDSALPTGAYAHSFGMEGLVQLEEVRNTDGLAQFIFDEVAHNFVQVDLPVIREVCAAVRSSSYGKLLEIDATAWALLPTHELRSASSRIGRQTWNLYGKLLADEPRAFKVYLRCGEYLSRYSLTVVSGTLAACLGIPVAAAMQAYARQALANFLQTSIKLLQTGPTEVQQLIYKLGAEIPKWIKLSNAVDLESAGSLSPRWDIASARHEFADRRLYIS
jgi:urease accessory protein